MASEPIRLDPASTALIVQDMQNDTITDGGAFSDSGAPAHAKSQGAVEHVAALAATCRERGVPVIHVHYIVDAGAPGLQLNAPLFQGIKESAAVVRGTWGAAPVDGLEPQPGDHVIEKMRINAFYGTRLETLLRGLQVKTLLISGAWTNMSIEHTARHAADAGFEVIVVSDGTATISEEWQAAALNYALTRVGQALPTAELIDALQE